MEIFWDLFEYLFQNWRKSWIILIIKIRLVFSLLIFLWLYHWWRANERISQTYLVSLFCISFIDSFCLNNKPSRFLTCHLMGGLAIAHWKFSPFDTTMLRSCVLLLLLQARRPKPIEFPQWTQGTVAGRESVDFQRQLRSLCCQFYSISCSTRPKCHLFRIEKRCRQLGVSPLAGQLKRQSDGQSQSYRDCSTQRIVGFRCWNRSDQKFCDAQ